MREHVTDYWWLYLIVASSISMLAVVVSEEKRDRVATRTCVLSGLVPVTYQGETYCVPAEELVQP